MGCFNLSCGYSGLEVHTDDEVQLFLMTNNAFGDGFVGFTCYPHDCYSLLGPGIPAKYDEYGWYEIDDTNLVAQHLQQKITSSIIPLTEEQCSRDRGGKKDIMQAIRQADETGEPRPLIDWAIIGDMIHDGELFVKNKYDREVQVYVSKFAVHKHFYDKFNSQDLKESWYKDDSPLMRDKIRSLVQELRTEEDKSEMAALEAMAKEDMTDEQKAKLRRFYRNMFRSMSDELRMDYISDAFSIDKLAKFTNQDGDQITEDELVEAYHGLIALHSAMSNANKMYLPQGPGHQCYNFEDEIAYHESILEFVKEQHKQKMISWGEWDENGKPFEFDENGDPIDDDE